MKEAWLLRDSIKVKVDGGNNQSGSQRRRAEALRNEASVALRGLFVYGHRAGGGDDTNNGWEGERQTSNSEIVSTAPGGFNLHHNPDSNSGDSWGMASASHQEGLRIIDDDEAAFEAADVAAWRAVQAEFPDLRNESSGGGPLHQPPLQNTGHDDNDHSQMLETVWHTANLTIIEDNEKVKRLELQRQRYFFQALEQK